MPRNNMAAAAPMAKLHHGVGPAVLHLGVGAAALHLDGGALGLRLGAEELALHHGVGAAKLRLYTEAARLRRDAGAIRARRRDGGATDPSWAGSAGARFRPLIRSGSRATARREVLPWT